MIRNLKKIIKKQKKARINKPLFYYLKYSKMTQINLENKDYQSETELFLDELKNNLDQLKDEIIGTFEYKNRSRDWKYFVFSYNTIEWEKVDDIKQKYIKQYWWSLESILVTDAKWKIINDLEFKWWEKIYLKVKMENHHPIEFVDSKENSWQTQKSCNINVPWWTPTSLRQIYQDEFDVVIEKDRFIITDKNWNLYEDSHKFEVWETVILTIKEKPDMDSADTNQESNEKKDGENKYKEMIENQKAPLTHWNRSNPEISITFDDGYWTENIKYILDTLKWSWIHATFFVLWDCLQKNPDLWIRAKNEGHQICCHTYTHIYLNNSWDITSFNSNLNKDIKIDSWIKNIKDLLWEAYYRNLQAKSWEDFPKSIQSNLLLETEILMREAQIKKTLWKEYLDTFKQNYPFFRFPGWCGAYRPNNIAVLKKLWYLSIWWSDDFYRWSGKNRKHMSVEWVKDIEIKNWDIPLFHFKQDDYKYIDAYIENLKKQKKSSTTVSDIIE